MHRCHNTESLLDKKRHFRIWYKKSFVSSSVWNMQSSSYSSNNLIVFQMPKYYLSSSRNYLSAPFKVVLDKCFMRPFTIYAYLLSTQPYCRWSTSCLHPQENSLFARLGLTQHTMNWRAIIRSIRNYRLLGEGQIQWYIRHLYLIWPHL